MCKVRLCAGPARGTYIISKFVCRTHNGYLTQGCCEIRELRAGKFPPRSRKSASFQQRRPAGGARRGAGNLESRLHLADCPLEHATPLQRRRGEGRMPLSGKIMYCGPVLRHPAEPLPAVDLRWPSMAGWQVQYRVGAEDYSPAHHRTGRAGLASSSLDRSVRVATAIALTPIGCGCGRYRRATTG
jgi:hypothetical protein